MGESKLDLLQGTAIMPDRMHPDSILCTGPYGTAKQDSSIIRGVANAG
jgi:hypothetical protein